LFRLLLFLLGARALPRPADPALAGYQPGPALAPGARGSGPGRVAHPVPGPGQADDPHWPDPRSWPPEPHWPGLPGPPEVPGTPGRPEAPGGPARPGREQRGRRPGWRRRRMIWLAVAAAAALIFRRAIASATLTALAAVLHMAGISVHLPRIAFGWPWQSVTAGTTTNTDIGPWVLQKIEGISRPALGQANFTFLFTHRVTRNIGPWPCWYASTFYAVGRASATVDLNPGPAWWRPSAGHYRLQVLSRPAGGLPGQVAVTMVLPQPQLPSSPHDVSIDNMASRPVSVQHSWTYPGFGCGLVLHPQFPESVLYAEAQRLAFARAEHSPQITGPLIAAAQSVADRTVRDNFVQPTVNALGYDLKRFTLSWTSPTRAGASRRA